jgi:PLP dependent protein
VLSPADTDRLAQNLDAVRARIAAACLSAGREPSEVRLVAVTKYAGVPYAAALLALGQRDLGENRVDHLLALDSGLQTTEPRPRWHMIGHLQRNKAKAVANVIDVLHSLDSLKLAAALEKHRDTTLSPIETYAQVRLGAGESRSGLDPDALEPFLESATGLTRLRLVGLMGLPPAGSPEDARPHFQTLRKLRAPGLEGLSMGMTSDLEVAIEEGASVVRVGRALLDGLSAEALGSEPLNTP